MNIFAHALWAVANSVWQSAAIAGLAWTVLRFVRRTTAALRYAVWGAVLIAAAVLPFVNSAMPARVVSIQSARATYRLSETSIRETPGRARSVRAIPVRAIPVRAIQGRETHAVPPAQTLAPHKQVPNSTPVSRAAGYAVAAAEIKTPGSPTQPMVAWMRSAAASISFWISDRAWVALWAWAFVSSLLLVRLAVGFAKLRRIKNGLVRLEDADIVASCRAEARPVTVGASDDVDCPCVIGYARPVVALPVSLVRELDRLDLSRVLAHELGHIRRWDDWANLLQQVVRAVWFFNPVVHIACRALDVDREIACDDLVAARHSDRLEYAKCLTEIARRTTFAEHLAPAAGFFPDRRQIVVRIEELLDRNHDGSARVGLVPAVTAGLLLIAVLALAKYQVPAFAMSEKTPPIAATAPVPVAPARIAARAVAPIAERPASAPHPVTTQRPVVAPAVVAKPATPAAAAHPAPKVVSAIKAVKYSIVTIKLATKRVTAIVARMVPAPLVTAPQVSVAQVSAAQMYPNAAPAAPAAPASTKADDFLDALASAGYTHLSVDELISVRNAGVTSSYLRTLKQFGVLPMPVSKLIALANSGVSADFIATMRNAGYGNLSSDDLISLSNAGVTSRFVQDMTASGHAKPSPRELISLANAGVSASYVNTLAKNGYANLSIDSLISLANAGVSSAFISEMAKQGYTGMSVDTLKALANAGVSPSYVRALADVGYSRVSTDDLIRMANAGVTARLVKSLRSHGIGDKGNLSVDELIKLANAGF